MSLPTYIGAVTVRVVMSTNIVSYDLHGLRSVSGQPCHVFNTLSYSRNVWMLVLGHPSCVTGAERSLLRPIHVANNCLLELRGIGVSKCADVYGEFPC